MLLCSTAGTITLGCVAGPFEHVNPNDFHFAGTMTIVASRDTVSPANPIVIFKVVTDPVVNGWEPNWLITSGGGLLYRGHGVFELGATPLVPTEVRITASFAERSISRTIIRAPAP